MDENAEHYTSILSEGKSINLQQEASISSPEGDRLLSSYPIIFCVKCCIEYSKKVDDACHGFRDTFYLCNHFGIASLSSPVYIPIL